MACVAPWPAIAKRKGANHDGDRQKMGAEPQLVRFRDHYSNRPERRRSAWLNPCVTRAVESFCSAIFPRCASIWVTLSLASETGEARTVIMLATGTSMRGRSTQQLRGCWCCARKSLSAKPHWRCPLKALFFKPLPLAYLHKCGALGTECKRSRIWVPSVMFQNT